MITERKNKLKVALQAKGLHLIQHSERLYAELRENVARNIKRPNLGYREWYRGTW